MALRDLKLAVRVNAGLPSATEVEVKTTQGARACYRLQSIPFYLAAQCAKLLPESPHEQATPAG